MESQLSVEYEIVEPITNKSFISESYYEAVDYFERHWTVYESHISVVRFGLTTSTQSVTTLWTSNTNDNEEENHDRR
jgi:hypothetical protein